MMDTFFLTVGVLVLSISSYDSQAQSPLQSADYKVETIVQDTLTDTLTIAYGVDYIMGKFDPATHPDFIEIPAEYRDKELRYLRKDVLAAFIKMYDAAKESGITLVIKSATRNFDNQKRIWENKWTGRTILEDNINAAEAIPDYEERARKILQYSSMPGTSRHHWGTDIDLNNFNNEWFEHGEGYKIYTWLKEHAHEYGFCQPYTKMGSDRHSGYLEERWHWSYIPVASVLTDEAERLLQNGMIQGFLGDDTADIVDMLHNYILGISPACRPK